MDKLELVIFDMDGLMFDTEKIAFTSWQKAAAKFGYEIKMEIFTKTVGVNFEGTKNIYIKHFGELFPIESIGFERLRIAEDIVNESGVPVKIGLYELLNYLKEANIKMAVATSTSRARAMKLLKMANIDQCFNYIICGDDIVNSKPNPEIFLKVAEELNCIPENCIVLEDSEVGILAASRAGMRPIMIPDMKEPDEDIRKIIFKKLSSLNDVRSIIEGVVYGIEVT